MALIYITGPAGSGKSTLQFELQRHGLNAFDEDEPGIGAPHNKSTGQAASIPPTERRTEEWFGDHEYRVFPAKLKSLKSASATNNVFLFGNSLKSNEITAYIDKVMYLDIDDSTMRSRLLSRTDNDYGKSDAEFERVLKRKVSDLKLIESVDYTVIDATKPVDDVVSRILSLAQE